MKTQEFFTTALNTTDFFVKLYLSDFSEDEMLVRPDPAANHAAYQFGHFLKTEQGIIQAVKPDSGVGFPEGFVEKHSQSNARSNNRADFLSKEEYLRLYDEQRAVTRSVIAGMSEADFDKPAPESMRKMAQTLGGALYVAAVHPMLHCGQFAVIRRTLGKPVLL